MHPIATNRQVLQTIAEGTLVALQRREAMPTVLRAASAAGLSDEEIGTQRDTVVNALEAALTQMPGYESHRQRAAALLNDPCSTVARKHRS